MWLYRNIKSGKIISMSESAYNFLTKKDHEDIKPYEKPEVKVPDVLKESIQSQSIAQVGKKRGRHAKV